MENAHDISDNNNVTINNNASSNNVDDADGIAIENGESDQDRSCHDQPAAQAPQAAVTALSSPKIAVTNSPPTTGETISALTSSSSSSSSITRSKDTMVFVHDPKKITLKFLFANRDGVHVLLDCKPSDTVGEVKGALLSVWPKEMPDCSGGDRLRLICMGKGILMPDSKTLQAAEVPVFKTHATPINVSVKPEPEGLEDYGKGGTSKKAIASNSAGGGRNTSGGRGPGAGRGGNQRTNNGRSGNASSGCSCVIM